METELQYHIDVIITSSQALISQTDGPLSEKQDQFVRIILANAEKFIHLAARFVSLPLAEVSRDLRHELGNPLTPIYGYSELLLTRMMDDLTPEQREHVHLIAQSTDELRRVVDEMVARARAYASMSS